MKTFIKHKWRLILTIITFIALSLFVYALRKQIFDTFANLKDVNAWALLLIPPIQFLYYHNFTRFYQGLFLILGHRPPYHFTFRTALELNFVNTVFPSGGVSGFSYFGLRMKKQGISPAKATLVQTMRFALVFISFQLLLFIGLLILAIGGQASNLAILVAGSMSTLLIVGTLALAYIIGSEKRINAFFTFLTRVFNRLVQIVRPTHPETISIVRVRKLFTEYHENYALLKENYKELKWPLIHALLASVAEITTIYVVYLAFGQLVNPGAVIIGYAIANFAGLLSVMPGGVGVYEALMTGVMASVGVSPAVSLPVTIMYRVLSMLLQLPVGAVFYHRALSEAPPAEQAELKSAVQETPPQDMPVS